MGSEKMYIVMSNLYERFPVWELLGRLGHVLKILFSLFMISFREKTRKERTKLTKAPCQKSGNAFMMDS